MQTKRVVDRNRSAWPGYLPAGRAIVCSVVAVIRAQVLLCLNWRGCETHTAAIAVVLGEMPDEYAASPGHPAPPYRGHYGHPELYWGLLDV